MSSSKKEDVKSGGSWEDLVRKEVCLISSWLLVTPSDHTPKEHPGECFGWSDYVEQPRS